MKSHKARIIIVGGGAAGYFLAANLIQSKDYEVIILEHGQTPLRKVEASGGGRCNLTHACFDPADLIGFYPRGNRELRGVFSRFQPLDTMKWFELRGVKLRTLEDNCVFPASDSSRTIIDLLMREASVNGVKLRTSETVEKVEQLQDSSFQVFSSKGKYTADYLVFTTGSSSGGWAILKEMGHSIIKPVPSLFSFNLKDPALTELMGIVFDNSMVTVRTSTLSAATTESGKGSRRSRSKRSPIQAEGELLITHWGLSGPAILRLSSLGARELADCGYLFDISVNWIGISTMQALDDLKSAKTMYPKKTLRGLQPFKVPGRFWDYILAAADIPESLKLADASRVQLTRIAELITSSNLHVTGRSTYRTEFVTCGGVALPEVNFRTMESRIRKNLFIAGEALDIDGLTGGFNLQACWSEAYIISRELLTRIENAAE